MKRLLSDDNGLKTFMEISSDGETFNINKVQDITAMLALNKASANELGSKARSDCYNHAARIPAIIIAKWMIEDGIDVYNPDHMDKVKIKLNSSEYMYLRTNEMTL